MENWGFLWICHSLALIVLFAFTIGFMWRNVTVSWLYVFFFQAEDGIRDIGVTGVQTCALPISLDRRRPDRAPGPDREEGHPHREGCRRREDPRAAAGAGRAGADRKSTRLNS